MHTSKLVKNYRSLNKSNDKADDVSYANKHKPYSIIQKRHFYLMIRVTEDE